MESIESKLWRLEELMAQQKLTVTRSGCTVLYSTALHCTVLYCIVLYCTALYYVAVAVAVMVVEGG